MTRNRLARLTVLRTEDVGPSMRRVVLGDGDVAQVIERHAGFTDSYVKLAFLAEGVEYPDPIDLDVVRATMPSETWPVLRTYTIRHLDAVAGEVWIDLVTHGDEGLAGPWAQRVQPGETVHLRGPGGAYRPDPAADHHLLVGDESALPAIAASLESLPDGSRATAFIEVDGPGDEVAIESAGAVEVRWLHRAPAAAGTTTLLDDAVRAWEWPAGRVQAFVHGESALLKSVRPYVREHVERVDLSVSAYWRRGQTEEGFRAWKQDLAAQGEETILRPSAGGS